MKVDFETIANGGTATDGLDYPARRTYTHVILAGDKTAQMGFALIEDTVDDAGETVKARLSNARVVDAYGEKVRDLDITTSEATGTITAPTTTTTNVSNLTIGIQDATGDEDDGYLDFRVRLSRKYTDYVCYDFETISGGTATEGTDYLKIPKATYWMQIGKRVDKPFVRIIDDSDERQRRDREGQDQQCTAVRGRIPDDLHHESRGDRNNQEHRARERRQRPVGRIGRNRSHARSCAAARGRRASSVCCWRCSARAGDGTTVASSTPREEDDPPPGTQRDRSQRLEP